jgi:hypothetical protein
MKNINSLRKQYPRFFYKGYSFAYQNGDLKISFDFEIPPDIFFHPQTVIKNAPRKRGLENLIFNIGMMEIPSYWKATCSPEIVVAAGFLNKEQIAWWHDLILKGMGEFFYKNKIDFTKKNFLKITSLTTSLTKSSFPHLDLVKDKLQVRTLVPVGGGKDAVVTLELLKKAGMPLRPFLLNPKIEQKRILGLAKVEKPIIVERVIDRKLLELNRNGYPNGHTPFSAYLAFLTTLCAALFEYKYIAFSNERSSNEGNVKYLGRMINHQYSKSFEFEKKFRQYSKKYLAKNIEYFSFLRPLYELQIARIFARYPKYFPAFLSCNEAHKTTSGTRKPTGKWCGKCSKCLFVWIALYPFVAEKQLLKIFKKNLFKDKSLIPLIEQLIGKRGFKPFECVGTTKESKVALALSQGKKKDHKILHSWDTKHFLPLQFERILKKVL